MIWAYPAALCLSLALDLWRGWRSSRSGKARTEAIRIITSYRCQIGLKRMRAEWQGGAYLVEPADVDRVLLQLQDVLLYGPRPETKTGGDS